MPWVVIEGAKPWDGRYRLDLGDDFSTHEWGWIKRLSGYMPLTVDDGYDGGDPELFAALAVIAIRRAGRIDWDGARAVFDRIGEGPFGSTCRLEPDEGEDDAGPPERSSSANGSTSGEGSLAKSERSDGPPSHSGAPVSATSESRPAWSAT